MDLIFFDLDGTLLNASSEISPFTQETLGLLREKDIAYTVATGRSLLSAKNIVAGHFFELPHIYNNGVTIWDPAKQALSFDNLLEHSEIEDVVNAALAQGITPFVNTIDNHQHFIYHSQVRHPIEKELVEKYFARTDAKLLPLEALPKNSDVTNISMIGENTKVASIWNEINDHPHLIAYSGPAHEGRDNSWMDVHHRLANKGSAVNNLKVDLGASNVICFGDGENDLSMFELADECYAPANAKPQVKSKASAVIGHNHDDGIAHFLRERFSL